MRVCQVGYKVTPYNADNFAYHICARNYDWTSGAMEADGLLLMILEIEAKYEWHILVDYMVKDDDTKMKKLFHMLNIV